MTTRTAGPVQRIGFAVLAFTLAFLACGAAIAADVERRIPVTRDTAGSGLTMEISREGTRRTAAPFVTLNHPTVERIEERIAKKTARLAAKEIPSEANAAGSAPGIGQTGASLECSGRPGTSYSSLPRVPKEITVRSVEGFIKELRASRKEKPAPVVVAPPEQRVGMADTSRR